MDQPLQTTLEAIQIELDRIAESGFETFDIWIPEDLTLNGNPIPGEIAMFIMVERAKEVGYRPDSVIEVEGGGVYTFRRME
jgi:hypothetical protein